MRRHVILLVLVLLLLVLGVTAVTQAQSDQQPNSRIPIKKPPAQMIAGSVADAVPLEPVFKNPTTPLTFVADAPADSCELATAMILTYNFPADGNASNMSAYTEADDDPTLSCMWGNPFSDQGFRTGWFKLLSPVDGSVTFSTFGSGFDTVLAVYEGECGALALRSCNDDTNGFTSETGISVTAGGVYYIEIADWNLGIVDTLDMEFSAILQPVDSRWQQVITSPNVPAITRHATAVRGDQIFVVGGQTVAGAEPQISNKLQAYNTVSGVWQDLPDIPGAGYSDTTVARLGNRIYLPSGYSGSDIYDGQHWRYNIDTQLWELKAGIPPDELPGGKNFAWAAAAEHPAGNRYYLTGGTNGAPFDPDVVVNNTNFVYTPATATWDKLTPMQRGRYAHTADWVPQNNLGLCVVGGITTGNQLIPDGECLAIGANNWITIGELNVPRYGHGSAVGPDGRWYVFGGFSAIGLPVALTEYYDPATNSWIAMDVSANLGNYQNVLPRAFPRGEFMGNYLWTIGGSIVADGEQAIAIMEKMWLPPENVIFPVIFNNVTDVTRNDDTLETARPIGFNQIQTRNFDSQRDFDDFYTFFLPVNQAVNITLDVPANNDFDLRVYDANKFIWANSSQPFNGVDEVVNQNLGRRQYYIRVSRAFPTGQPDKNAYYTLKLE